ncbi:Crp/Fnr family transcriptional regulator [Chitinophaga sp. 22620]|uniref:Crp/Fnr family transcriptional regulator n=1 Tax=Chitinophaga sp. 22620 TaxID=3453952 RepID=UPI003F87285A
MDNLRSAFWKTGLQDNDLDIICAWFRAKQYDKNEYLSRPGEVAHKLYFIEKGSVILGQEADDRIVTRHLALENEFIGCLESFSKQAATPEFLRATAPSLVYEISKTDFDTALKTYPPLQHFYQQFIFETLLKCQQRITDLIGKDAKSYYQDIMQNRPDYIRKMRQYDLASYMGIEPQSLSRLRTAQKNDPQA